MAVIASFQTESRLSFVILGRRGALRVTRFHVFTLRKLCERFASQLSVFCEITRFSILHKVPRSKGVNYAKFIHTLIALNQNES